MSLNSFSFSLLDKPKKLFALLRAVDPSGSEEALQLLLMKMRENGKLKFDIGKGIWRRA
jgi:hypothetical protein